MNGGGWQLFPSELEDDQALQSEIVRLHQEILRGHFAGDPLINANLGVQQRAFRRLEQWRVLVLLTPWMLSRMLFPNRPLEIAIPVEWRASNRSSEDYTVLGPGVEIEILGQRQRAHLNYHARLGHYLLQPLCLNMAGYASPEAVFEAWDGVIRTRDENMKRMQRDCPWQKEVSRRELFTRFRANKRTDESGNDA